MRVSLEGEDALPSLHSIIGLVSPYLQMYDEFTARENLQFFLAARGLRNLEPEIQPLLEQLQLKGRLDEPVRTFSSGMKQRVKYAFALIHHPPILILDEPMSNLDLDGTELVKEIMGRQRSEGILIVATNDVSDVDRYDKRVDLGKSS
jgi:heme exporter protein A